MSVNKPLKRRRRLSIAIPASIVEDIPHLREKTSRIGLIGRALAIFRVDEVIIYMDKPGRNQRRDAELLNLILSYMETPQYLRKHLFKIMPELKYAGTLPPLRTPHHPLQSRIKDLRIGEYRDGVIVSTDRRGAYVDIGVEKPAFIPDLKAALNSRVTVKIVRRAGRRVEAKLSDREEVNVYWGYRINPSWKTLKDLIEDSRFDIKIATSKYGRSISELIPDLTDRLKASRRILILFGAPAKGLYEIAEAVGVDLEEAVDYVINTIPNQATETVRTEEAIYATLSILNLYID